ncbi:glycosyltransferase [Actinomyces minihominis]|uniref:glycosyltransferase n=1 Tax=Actinomyces minihominis TaxID=2002838 RepID=UPI000C072E47|nr:glycosyltransferase [Actinomyces minihominis]
MDRPVVNIAMATYNGQPWIGRQVETILDQEDVEVRLVISDDGSTDNTREWAEELASTDSRVRVLPQRVGEAGVAANFLYALRHLDVQPGQYAAFTDQDDLWQPRKLIEEIEFMHEAGARAVSSNVAAFTVLPDGEVTRTVIHKDQPQTEWDFIFEAPGAGSTYVFDYVAWKILVDYLEQWGSEDVAVHDWFVYAVLRGAGVPWAIDPRPHVAYRQHERNVAGAHRGVRAKVNRWHLLRSGHYRSQFLLMTEVALNAAVDAERDEQFLEGLMKWHEILCDTSARGRLEVARRARSMRRRPVEQVALATACLLGVW